MKGFSEFVASPASCRIACSPVWLAWQVIFPSCFFGVLLTARRDVTDIAECKKVALTSGMAALPGIALAIRF